MFKNVAEHNEIELIILWKEDRLVQVRDNERFAIATGYVGQRWILLNSCDPKAALSQQTGKVTLSSADVEYSAARSSSYQAQNHGMTRPVICFQHIGRRRV